MEGRGRGGEDGEDGAWFEVGVGFPVDDVVEVVVVGGTARVDLHGEDDADELPWGEWHESGRVAVAIEEGAEASFDVLELFEEFPFLFEGGVPAVVFDVLDDGHEECACVAFVEGDGVGGGADGSTL